MFGQRKPKLESHSWQAWLILLPVLVLALAGLHALRQDRRLVESEARDRARRLANDWLRSISEEWDATEARATNRSPDALSRSEPSDGYFFQLDPMGNLLVPSDYSPVPDPEPFNFGGLTPDQLQRWQAARQLELQSEDSIKIAEALQHFAENPLPPRLEAWGRFGAALHLSRAGRNQEAAETFANLAAAFPAQVTESGLRFSHLADLHRLKLGEVPREALSQLCSNAVYRPSLLTPQLLELAEQAKHQSSASLSMETDYNNVWARHELTREIVRAARRQAQPRTPGSPGSGGSRRRACCSPSTKSREAGGRGNPMFQAESDGGRPEISRA